MATAEQAAKTRHPSWRPVLLSDLPVWKKIPLRVWLLILGAVGGFIAVRTYAGAYFTFLQSVPAVKHAYDAAFPVDWIRHLIIRDESEKAEALIVVQVIGYYFARKWPRKAPTRWDRLEGWLRVANERIDGHDLPVVLLAPLWALVYVLPGEGIGALALWLAHQNAAEPKPWQIALVGLLGSFVMGRRIARGFAYHLQRLLIRERLENAKDIPAWWMIWPLQRHFEWARDHWAVRTHTAHRHPRLRRASHVLAGTFAVAVILALTYVGWYVMKYFTFDWAAPFTGLHFRLPDLWRGVI